MMDRIKKIISFVFSNQVLIKILIVTAISTLLNIMGGGIRLHHDHYHSFGYGDIDLNVKLKGDR